MSEEQQVNGLDTIQKLAVDQPKSISVPYGLQYSQTVIQQRWNSLYIAILPYCIRCKAPLVWHTHPNSTLFHCPNCGTEWIMDKDWEAHRKSKIEDGHE
jgi:predicted RNA-binding Zn-ribbon protein involved in translation (DUF1610 family)